MTLPEVAPCVDAMASRFAAGRWSGEITAARRDHDARRGAVCDDEELYPAHMAGFLEWFTLERPLQGGPPPVARLLQDAAPGSEPELRRLQWALAASHRSLFSLVAAPVGAVRLDDLLWGGRWRVAVDGPLMGLRAGDIFEARLIPWEERVVFGPVFCYHPRPATDSILALVGQGLGGGRSAGEIIDMLAAMRLKFSRFRNIAVDRIYAAPAGRGGGVGPGESRQP